MEGNLSLSKILIMDSGVGGLSVAHEVHNLIPDCQIHYFADHAATPYGEKDPSWLLDRVVQAATHMVNRVEPDLLIIACNTASTLSLPSLRAAFSIPIIGVVPAVKTASSATQNGKIGVLATPITIDSEYLNDLIENYAPQHEIIRVASSKLVSLAEAKMYGQAIDLDELGSIISPFLQANCDSVVLGCTHFPLLKNELSQLAPKTQWIDSGRAIANRAASLLGPIARQTSKTSHLNEQHYFYTSAMGQTGLKTKLVQLNFKTNEYISHLDNLTSSKGVNHVEC